MYMSKILSILPLLAGFCFAVPYEKRTISSGVQLYAYGTNISGLPLYYGNADGLAYVGDNPPSTYSNLTWTTDSTGSVPWNATISNSTNVGAFYIVTSNSSYESAGFISPNQTTTVTDSATIGFAMYGGQVVFIDNGTFEAKFWAETTDTTGVWSLKWDNDGRFQADSTPVVIKTIAPAYNAVRT